MNFGLLDGETLSKEGAITFLTLLDLFQLLDNFFGSTGTQLAAHANITYLRPFNTYKQRQTKSSQRSFSKKHILNFLIKFL